MSPLLCKSGLILNKIFSIASRLGVYLNAPLNNKSGTVFGDIQLPVQ